MHGLADHTPKGAIYQFSKSGQLTAESFSEGAKITLSNSKTSFKKKPRRTIK